MRVVCQLFGIATDEVMKYEAATPVPQASACRPSHAHRSVGGTIGRGRKGSACPQSAASNRLQIRFFDDSTCHRRRARIDAMSFS